MSADEMTDGEMIRAAADLIESRNPGNPIAAGLNVMAGIADKPGADLKMRLAVGNAVMVARAVLATAAKAEVAMAVLTPDDPDLPEER